MENKPLRKDIPINLPNTFESEALNIRNKLLSWRFKNYQRISLNEQAIDLSLEPRLNQIIMPLLSIEIKK